MDRDAIANDAPHARFMVGYNCPRQLLGKAALLDHETFAIARHDIVQAHCLTHEIGNHRQESNVLVETKICPAVPNPVDGQRTNHPVAFLDRNPDKRDF